MNRSFFRPLLALSILLAAPAAALAEPIAWVVRINGTPQITPKGASRQALPRGKALYDGDVVETDAASKIKILLSDDSILAIGPRSRVKMGAVEIQPKSRKARLDVLAGRFKIAISKFFGGPTDFEVRTPTAVAGVRGTVLWGDTEVDAICALEGNIEVRSLTGAPDSAKLGGGQCVGELGQGKTTPISPSAEDVAGYLKEVTLE